MNSTKFCCCSTNMCNENFTDIYKPGEEPPPEKAPKPTIDMTWLWLLVSFICCVIFLVLWISCWLFAPWKTTKNLEDIESAQPLPPSTDYSLDKLKLLNVIGNSIIHISTYLDNPFIRVLCYHLFGCKKECTQCGKIKCLFFNM